MQDIISCHNFKLTTNGLAQTDRQTDIRTCRAVSSQLKRIRRVRGVDIMRRTHKSAQKESNLMIRVVSFAISTPSEPLKASYSSPDMCLSVYEKIWWFGALWCLWQCSVRKMTGVYNGKIIIIMSPVKISPNLWLGQDIQMMIPLGSLYFPLIWFVALIRSIYPHIHLYLMSFLPISLWHKTAQLDFNKAQISAVLIGSWQL